MASYLMTDVYNICSSSELKKIIKVENLTKDDI